MLEMKEDEFKPFRFKRIKKVSEHQLRQIWNTHFSDKPFPKIQAIILEDKEFLNFLKQCNRETQIKEYGEVVPDEKVYGCLSETPKGLLICVRSSSSLQEILEHELRHAYFEHYKKW
jgi:hypothetical protein